MDNRSTRYYFRQVCKCKFHNNHCKFPCMEFAHLFVWRNFLPRATSTVVIDGSSKRTANTKLINSYLKWLLTPTTHKAIPVVVVNVNIHEHNSLPSVSVVLLHVQPWNLHIFSPFLLGQLPLIYWYSTLHSWPFPHQACMRVHQSASTCTLILWKMKDDHCEDWTLACTSNNCTTLYCTSGKYGLA